MPASTSPIRRGRARRRWSAVVGLVLAASTLTGCRVPLTENCEIWWLEPAAFNPGGPLDPTNGSAILVIGLLIPIPVCGDQRFV